MNWLKRRELRPRPRLSIRGGRSAMARTTTGRGRRTGGGGKGYYGEEQWWRRGAAGANVPFLGTGARGFERLALEPSAERRRWPVSRRKIVRTGATRELDVEGEQLSE
ncbi:hypothetical protein HPB50_020618 [Hyalomma asiaticum]|uniref:Uncharacterized protein n=1 Tax=Hyalomma asiaticum TaxID=266040 RepID=A0ACB7SYC7_HYAAI|nr:hypothetical protein HPB50_020618 [Hyalomma asiaticum]